MDKPLVRATGKRMIEHFTRDGERPVTSVVVYRFRDIDELGRA